MHGPDRFTKLLAELGMSIPVVVDSNTKKSTGTALALPSNVAAATRVVDDGIDGAALVLPDLDREEARRRMRERLVMNGDNPVFPISFGADVVEIDGIKDLRIFTTVNIPGVGEVEVIPLITLGVNYVGQSNGRFEPLSEFQCLLFRPKGQDPRKKPQPYKAYPLGLVSKSVLDTWNTVANAMPHLNWPVIDLIPNTLRKAGTRKIVYAPKCLKTLSFQNDRKPDKRKGNRRQENKPSEFQVVGYLFGQMLKLHPRSQEPTVPVLDESGAQKMEDDTPLVKLDKRKLVWRVKLGEGSLELSLLGVEGEYKDDDRVPVIAVSTQMDPFEVLGVTPLTVDVEMVNQHTHAWLTRPYDERNPLYKYAFENGLVTENDSRETARSILEDLGRTAVIKVRDDMFDTFDAVTARLTTADEKPSIEDVLGGKRLKVVLRRLNTDDVAAKWIDSKIEGNFDPKSPFHMGVRWFVINMIAKLASYNDPEEQKSVVAPPAPPAEPETSAEPPALEVAEQASAPADATQKPAPKARKASAKTPKDEPAAPAPA